MRLEQKDKNAGNINRIDRRKNNSHIIVLFRRVHIYIFPFTGESIQGDEKKQG